MTKCSKTRKQLRFASIVFSFLCKLRKLTIFVFYFLPGTDWLFLCLHLIKAKLIFSYFENCHCANLI
jgi:hypothetical protein